MFDKIVITLFLTSSYGMYLLTRGAYSPLLGEFGYDNGALKAFLLSWTILFIVYYFTKKTKLSLPVNITRKKYSYEKISMIFFIILVILLLVILFYFGAYKIWIGSIGKGDFRSTLGPLGAIAFGLSKFTAPSIGAYLAYIYKKKQIKNKKMLFLNLFIIFLIGSSWGTKSFGLFILLPAMTIILWDLKFYNFIILFILALLAMIVIAIYINNRFTFGMATNFVLSRLTIMQAEVPWKIWDLQITNHLDVNYIQTIPSFIGDKLLFLLTGLSRGDISEWISHHYGLLLTSLVYDNTYNIMHGFNVTGTFFSEALISLGYFGIVIFPLFAGIFLGILYNSIIKAMKNNNPIVVSILLSYYYFVFFAWLNSG